MQLHYSETKLFIELDFIQSILLECFLQLPFYFSLILPLNLDEIMIPLPLEEKNTILLCAGQDKRIFIL